MFKYTNQSNFSNVNIDLRHNLKVLTDEFGLKILYVRNNKFVKCTCFNDLHQAGNPSCKKCYGSGFFCSVQKIPAIESSNRAYFDNNNIINRNFGATDQKNEIYYIKHHHTPKERDFILKVTWKNDLPVDIVRVLEIINVFEMRGDDGRVEVNGCLVANRTDLVDQFQKNLKSIPKKGLKNLIKDKYIWPYKE